MSPALLPPRRSPGHPPIKLACRYLCSVPVPLTLRIVADFVSFAVLGRMLRHRRIRQVSAAAFSVRIVLEVLAW